jgi:hypothetical protein
MMLSCRYKLPSAFKQQGSEVSPLIEALPGKGDGVFGALPSPTEKLKDVRNVLVGKYFTTLPGMLVTFIDGSNGEAARLVTAVCSVVAYVCTSSVRLPQASAWDCRCQLGTVALPHQAQLPGLAATANQPGKSC